MLPTVDFLAADSVKSPIAAAVTGHCPNAAATPTERQSSPESLFTTRFPPSMKKFDPSADLTPPSQKQQQRPRRLEQQPTTRAEIEEEECFGDDDLNRHSSPDENVRIISTTMASKSSASLAPLLLLSSSSSFNEMPRGSSSRTAAIAKPEETDDDSPLFIGRTQIAFVTLIRQLSRMTWHAGTIFDRLSNDIEKIHEQSQRLESRIRILRTRVDPLLNKKAPKTKSEVGLVRFTRVNIHYRSVDNKYDEQDEDDGANDEDKDRRIIDGGRSSGLFTASTRSPAINNLYEQAERDPGSSKRPMSPAVEHCATQTDTNDIRTRRSGATTTTIRRGVTLSVLSPNETSASSSKLVLRPSSTTNLIGQESSSSTATTVLERSQQDDEEEEDEFGKETTTTKKIGRPDGEIATTTLRRSSTTTTRRGERVPPEPSNYSAPTTASSSTVIAIDTNVAFQRSSKTRKSEGQYGEIIRRPKPDSKKEKRAGGGESIEEERRLPTDQIVPRQGRPIRRNTVVGFELSNDQRRERAVSVSNCDRLGISDCTDDRRRRMDDASGRRDGKDDFSQTTGDSIANEVVYEFAPFYRRKSKRLLSTGNFFSSLRRTSKKDKEKQRASVLPSPMAVSTPIKSKSNGHSKDESSVDYSSHHYSTKNDMSSSVHSDSAAAAGEEGDSKRSSTSAIKGIKQFFQRSASLRRSKKEKTRSMNATCPAEYVGFSSPPPPPIPPRLRTSSSVKGDESRLSTPAGNDDGGGEEDSENRSTSSSCGFQRNYAWRGGKTSLPISTTSQVIDLAAQLRDRPPPASLAVPPVPADQRCSKLSSSSSRDSAYSSCGKKLRPPSIVSLASLDFAESKANGWYRQGYQLEYPDECVRDEEETRHQHQQQQQRPQQRHSPPVKMTVATAAIVHASPPVSVKTTPNMERFNKIKSPKSAMVGGILQSTSRETSNSSPRSDVSSFVDSNYSCDREGYFTTMHRDCGLSRMIHVRRGDAPGVMEERKLLVVPPSIHDSTPPRAPPEGSLSSSGSLHTVTEPLSDNDRGQSVVEIISPPPPMTMRMTTTPVLRPAAKHRPADLSFPAAFNVTTTPPPVSSASSDAEVKFDLWLMSKFHAEQRMQQFRQQQQQNQLQQQQQQRQQQQSNSSQFISPINSHSPSSPGARFFARSFGRFSLPRNRKDSPGSNHNNSNCGQRGGKNDYVVEYLQSLGYAENELMHQRQQQQQPTQIRSPSHVDHSSCTMPRKTVRFCE